MSIAITSHYSLLHSIDRENPVHPDLKPLIGRWHSERIRRIDRYIQLCLAGGLNCVAGRQLPENTGVYLASRAGAITTSAAVMTHIERDGQLPKPLHFVNTLGNSAGYYLTRLLGVNGNTLVISDEHLSFEAALLHACLDLQAGRIEVALVGGFDEVPLPIEGHIERLDGPADTTALYEGTHWLLLGNSGERTLSPPCYLTAEQLQAWLAERPGLPVQASFTPGTAEQALPGCEHWKTFGNTTLPHGVFSGAALTALVEAGTPGVHLAKDQNGVYCAVALQ